MLINKERLSMLQASDDFWADEHETFVDVAAQDIKKSAQHIPQQTNKEDMWKRRDLTPSWGELRSLLKTLEKE